MEKQELIKNLLAKKAQKLNGEARSTVLCMACCEGHCTVSL